MSDTLLPYYDRELAAIKRLAAEFADTHPKIAGRLRLSADAVDDPHVARLLEGVAFLAGRVHHRLDDEFPELTDSLLGLLYPHYLAPMPSCMVVQLDCQTELLLPARLPAGDRVRYRTGARRRRCATARPAPSRSGRSRWRTSGSPACRSSRPPTRPPAGAAGVLRITLKCLSPEMTFQPTRRRSPALLPARPGQPDPAALRIAVRPCDLRRLCQHRRRSRPRHRARQQHPPAGFAPEEALLPWSARGFSGFRLLTEYFAFPEKFLFLDFTRIDTKTHGFGRQQAGDFRLSRPRRPGTGTQHRPIRARARLHPTGQPVPATLRADPPDPHRYRIPHRPRCPPAPRRRGLERRPRARNPAGRLLPPVAPVLPSE